MNKYPTADYPRSAPGAKSPKARTRWAYATGGILGLSAVGVYIHGTNALGMGTSKAHPAGAMLLTLIGFIGLLSWFGMRRDQRWGYAVALVSLVPYLALTARSAITYSTPGALLSFTMRLAIALYSVFRLGGGDGPR